MFDKRIVAIHAVDRETFTPERLVRYVKTMRRLGYTFVSVKEILEENCERLSIALTIDDAYKTCVFNVIPILRELQVPALLFVPTGLLDKKANDDELLSRECYANESTMSVEDVNEWLASGFQVGFHTHKHMDLYHASRLQDIENDFMLGISCMKNNNWEVEYFAYPKGFLPRNRPHFEKLLKENGITYAFTINWGKASKDNPFYVNRVCLGNKESFIWSVIKTMGLGDIYFNKKRIHKEQMI